MNRTLEGKKDSGQLCASIWPAVRRNFLFSFFALEEYPEWATRCREGRKGRKGLSMAMAMPILIKVQGGRVKN